MLNITKKILLFEYVHVDHPYTKRMMNFLIQLYLKLIQYDATVLLV